MDALFRYAFGCGILTAFRASSVLQSQISRCSSVVRVSRLTCTNSAGICVEPRAKQEKRSVLLRLLCPFFRCLLECLCGAEFREKPLSNMGKQAV